MYSNNHQTGERVRTLHVSLDREQTSRWSPLRLFNVTNAGLGDRWPCPCCLSPPEPWFLLSASLRPPPLLLHLCPPPTPPPPPASFLLLNVGAVLSCWFRGVTPEPPHPQGLFRHQQPPREAASLDVVALAGVTRREARPVLSLGYRRPGGGGRGVSAERDRRCCLWDIGYLAVPTTARPFPYFKTNVEKCQK